MPLLLAQDNTQPLSFLGMGLALSELRLQLRFSSLMPLLLAQPVGKLLVGIFKQVAVIPALPAAGASVCLLLMSRRICRVWSSGSLQGFTHLRIG